MSEWIDFARWHQCEQLTRPGIVFEITNAEGQILLTECTETVEVPFDWSSPPLQFRPVPMPEPVRSDPLPKPVERPVR